jgi:hypothetical protein
MSEQRGYRPHQVVGYDWVPPNLLINSGFEIWQRGVGPFTHSVYGRGPYSADEWGLFVNTGTITVQRSTLARFGTYCPSITTIGTNTQLDCGLEFYKSLEGLTLTFSAWVNCTSANAVRVSISDWTGSLSTKVSSAHPGDGQWHQLTTSSVISSGLVSTSAQPHSFAIDVGFWFPNSVTGCLIDGAICVVGNYPEGVPFVPTNPEEDLVRAQRFYEVGSNNYRSYGAASSVASITQRYKANKYASPSVSTTFTPSLGSATGAVTVGTYPTDGIKTTMTNGGVAGDFAGAFNWISEVP